MAPPVLIFDYIFSPYAQKIKFLLDALQVPYKRCEQPPVLPRKDLEALDITYRRIPVLSVGKDVYCDSQSIQSVVLNKDNGLAQKSLKQDPTDRAWEAWGGETFDRVLTVIPSAVLSPDFVKDRQTVFPIVTRPDLEQLRPSGLAELRSRLAFLENEVLTGNGPFINGKEISVADIHLIWPIRWALMDLGAAKEKGFGKEDFPKVWKMIDALPKSEPSTVDGEEAKKIILGAEYASKEPSIDDIDPLGVKQGNSVTVESLDSTPGSHPQAGKLVGTTVKEIVLGLDNGVRLHFPREGYIVKKA